MVKQALQIKRQYQSSIKNIILYLNITSMHKGLNRLLQIPKDRISHSCWPLQPWKARKEDPKFFSLTVASFRVSNIFYSPN